MNGDVVTWGAVAIAIGSAISIVTFWTRYSDRITKAEGATKAAREIADEAKKSAKEAADKAAALSDSLTAAAGLVKNALEIAQEAKKDAHEAAQKAEILGAAFGMYREQIARDYIHREVMREVEDRLTSAINGLGERLDRFTAAALQSTRHN